MAELEAEPKVTELIPMAHAADVRRSIDFYRRLGMEARGSHGTPWGSCHGSTWLAVTLNGCLLLRRTRHSQSAGRAFLSPLT